MRAFSYWACTDARLPLASGEVWHPIDYERIASGGPVTFREEIWANSGDFSKLKNVPKLSARLGQIFSTTRVAMDVAEGDVAEIPDVKVQDYTGSNGGEPFVFSDGIGLMGSEVRRCGAECLGYYDENTYPCALQIR